MVGMTQPHPILERLARHNAAAVAASTAAAPAVQTYGTVVRCIDGRCGVPAYGHLPYHALGVLGGHIGDRNAARFRVVAAATAQRAERRGRPHLLVCETHTDCAYRAKVSLSEAQVWEQFQRHATGLPNTVSAWISRDVETGVITVSGPGGSVSAVGLSPDVDAANLDVRLAAVGFAVPAIRNDLAYCLQENARYQRTPHTAREHREEGVVVGSGVSGDVAYFSVSDRVEELGLALGVAVELLHRHGVDQPFLMLSLAVEAGALAAHPASYRRTQERQRRDAAVALAAAGVLEHFCAYAATVDPTTGVLNGEPISLT